MVGGSLQNGGEQTSEIRGRHVRGGGMETQTQRSIVARNGAGVGAEATREAENRRGSGCSRDGGRGGGCPKSRQRIWILFKHNCSIARIVVFSVWLTLFKILSASRLIMMLAAVFKQITFLLRPEMSLSFRVIITCLENTYDCSFSAQFCLCGFSTNSSLLDRLRCVLKAFCSFPVTLPGPCLSTAYINSATFFLFGSKVTLT